MKHLFYIALTIVIFLSCEQQDKSINAVARVHDKYLYEEDILVKLPINYTKDDSLLLRNNFINNWAKEQLLLSKAEINLASKDDEILNLVENYRKELLIDKYKKAVLQQELDTVVTQLNIDNYYKENKEVYKLNENLIQLRYIHFNQEVTNKKEIIELFQSKRKQSLHTLIEKELEFNSFNFNDSIWISYKNAEKKLTFLKEEKKLKKNSFIQKEDSLGVYLVKVRNVLKRNDIAPKSYITPLIKQMVLHQRKLKLINKIEQTLITDAINKKQFEQY